jgi:bacillithiol biosynthesis cysteine-adding enzyme BshC
MFAAEQIPYNQTNAFSKIVRDYLDGSPQLNSFYGERPTLQGFEKIIQQKLRQHVDRELLVSVLEEQYRTVVASPMVKENIDLLLSEKSFTVCTAHQPNLFTGPLYFIYKILHTIRLADHLRQNFSQYNFIPVYYMGSEDADFAELNHTYVDGKKIEWNKQQKGAVGRMLVDQTLERLIDELEGQLLPLPNGKEVIALLRKCYTIGRNIQTATFELVNELYGSYGLVVLIPDHPALKRQMQSVLLDDLFHHTSSGLVQQTSEQLGKHYSVQAHPREINLFYLEDGIRERIIRDEDDFIVQHTDMRFSGDEMKKELEVYPERFSPNVILRGLFQETILPNLAFIGGGGEMAYWLQLKGLFQHYKIVYPVLVLRNSFLILEKKWKEKIEKLGLTVREFFQPEMQLMNRIVELNAEHPVSLNGNFEMAEALFQQIRTRAGAIDPTLTKHVAAIEARSLKTLQELQKKMLRAEKRKYADQQRQIAAIKAALFPNNGLQERVENFSGFYAKWGRSFIQELYEHSLALEQQFCVLTEE